MLNATYVCKIASLAAIYFMTTFILSEYYKLERGRFITTHSSVLNHKEKYIEIPTEILEKLCFLFVCPIERIMIAKIENYKD